MIWCAIIAYLTISARHCSQQQDELLVKRVEVRVLDSAYQQIITPYMVKAWLAKEGLALRDRPVSQVNTSQIEKLVKSRGFVKDAKVYIGIKGIVHIDLKQRAPIARVNTINGYNFYITDDNYILPLQSHSVQYVPIITGYFTPPFGREFVGSVDGLSKETKKKYEKNYEFFTKLINFVRFIRGDSFWNAQIVQINVSSEGSAGGSRAAQDPQIEIVPRVGNHVIMLGSLDDVQSKFDKLMNFYKNVLRYEGWDKHRYINLKYKNQVVCSD